MFQPSRGHPQGMLIHFESRVNKYMSRGKYQIKKKRITPYLAVLKPFTCDHIEYKQKAKYKA